LCDKLNTTIKLLLSSILPVEELLTCTATILFNNCCSSLPRAKRRDLFAIKQNLFHARPQRQLCGLIIFAPLREKDNLEKPN